MTFLARPIILTLNRRERHFPRFQPSHRILPNIRDSRSNFFLIWQYLSVNSYNEQFSVPPNSFQSPKLPSTEFLSSPGISPEFTPIKFSVGEQSLPVEFGPGGFLAEGVARIDFSTLLAENVLRQARKMDGTLAPFSPVYRL